VTTRSTETAERVPTADGSALRPQVALLLLFGDHILGSDLSLFSGSAIDVLARLGVSEHATRSTLTRMVGRGLLRRQREGRRMYFGLTPRAVEILRDGQQRIWRTGAVNDRWDGTWTLLCFSLPEAWQRQRHGLRSQLAWAGFGPLQGGLWIAPGHAPAQHIVAGLGLGAHVRVFRARADELTDIPQLIGDVYDLDGLARRYTAFLHRWDPDDGPVPVVDPLAARLTIVGEWLQVISRDPRLPVQHLPDGWPAVRAQQTFRHLAESLREPARALAATLLDTRPDATGAG
jgi:phenylacetic acid degradation operon negative regulatory protein